MAGYTKLFSDIVDSSVWREKNHVRVVWITLLALCDQDGYVRGSVGWLAGKAQVGVEECQEAIDKFLSPDPSSRTEDNDGRRIEQLSDGWLVLNYLSFRDRLSNDVKACQSRERVRKHRERYRALRNAPSVTVGDSASASEYEESKKREEGSLRGEENLPAEYVQQSELLIGDPPLDYPAWLTAYHNLGMEVQAVHEQVMNILRHEPAYRFERFGNWKILVWALESINRAQGRAQADTPLKSRLS